MAQAKPIDEDPGIAFVGQRKRGNRGQPMNLVAWLGIAIVCLLLGCGPAPIPVTMQGEVYFNGDVVESGIVSLIAIEKASVDTGAAIKNGRFTVFAESNLRPGRYRVEIRWAKPTGEKLAEPIYGHSSDIVEQVIPPRFNSDSVLRLELVEGNNTALFWLDAPPEEDDQNRP